METVVKRGGLFVMTDEAKKKFTIEDIEALPEGQRAELFDGEMIMMASPTVTHQAVLSWLFNQIYNQIKEKKGPCLVFPAPCAVYLLKDKWNYVEPDIVVICDRNKLDKKGCHGAPDWVIEIVSPSSQKLDCYRKLDYYERAGVREYWIVDPAKRQIMVHDLTQDKFPVIYTFEDTIKGGIYEEFAIDFSKMHDYEF